MYNHAIAPHLPVVPWYTPGMLNALGPIARQTAAALEALAHQLGHDAPLPSERMLAIELNVSRSTLRVALAHLEKANLIVKRGTTGRYTNLTPVQTSSSPPTKDELEARIIFESALIGDLALLLTTKQKTALSLLLDEHISQLLKMRDERTEIVDLSQKNQRFHQKLCDLHPNAHARQVLLLAAQHDNNTALTWDTPVEILITQHQLIVQALILGDRNLATAAVKINLATELNCWQ